MMVFRRDIGLEKSKCWKSYSKSYKMKKRIENPEENRAKPSV